jgi:hypothetical protein
VVDTESELFSAYSLIQLRLTDREDQGADEYFTKIYGVDLDELGELATGLIDLDEDMSLDDIEEEMFHIATFFYELGRSHQQLKDDVLLLGSDND